MMMTMMMITIKLVIVIIINIIIIIIIIINIIALKSVRDTFVMSPAQHYYRPLILAKVDHVWKPHALIQALQSFIV